MSITGLAGQGPVRVGLPIADLTAGNLLALGVSMALFDRTRTGVGKWVHTSLLEAQIFMLDFQASRWLISKEVAKQAGNDHPTGIPTGVFPSSDGHFNIAASSARVFGRFCEAIGKPEWKDKEEWNTLAKRSAVRKEINAAIAEITRTKPAAHWVELFEEAGVPCGPIYSIDQMFADPQVKHLGMATPVKSQRHGDLNVVANPINMEGLPRKVYNAVADAGQHTDEVLASVGYTKAEIEKLRANGVV
jgi:formyl-CoA transferase